MEELESYVEVEWGNCAVEGLGKCAVERSGKYAVEGLGKYVVEGWGMCVVEDWAKRAEEEAPEELAGIEEARKIDSREQGRVDWGERQSSEPSKPGHLP